MAKNIHINKREKGWEKRKSKTVIKLKIEWEEHMREKERERKIFS